MGLFTSLFSTSNEWISVKERRPQRGFNVILVDIDDNITEGWRDGEDYYCLQNDAPPVVFEDVTHWMNCPKAPKR